MILDGKYVANKLKEELKDKVSKNNYKIKLAIISVGNDDASNVYIKSEIDKCKYVGINVDVYNLEENTKEEDVISLIEYLNRKEDVNGILLESPLPKHIDTIKCTNKIDYKKDVEGVSSTSTGYLYLGMPYHVSCTAKGIIKLLDYYKIDLSGKNVCIINRSNIVGKPLMHLLLEKDATVTICHSKTNNLTKYTSDADIVVSAVGISNFIKENMIKEGCILIDVGINTLNGKVVGDALFDEVKNKCAYITPTPGGVGPMTSIMLIDNLIEKISLN